MGTEWHSYLLARELSKKHAVCVFSRAEGEGYEEYAEEFDGIPVKRIRTPLNQRMLARAHLDDRVALSFSEFLEDSEPQVIHVQHCIGLGFSVLEVAVQKRIPTVLFLHDFYLMCHRIHLLKPNGQLCPGPRTQGYCADCILSSDPSLSEVEARQVGLGRYRYAQRLLSKIDRVIVGSEFVKKVFYGNFPTIRKMTVSPLGLDLDFAKRFRKKDSKKLRFGYFGPIYHHKGVHILIEAFKSLNANNAELRIYGSGNPSYLEALQEQASNSNILFFGPYTHSQLDEVLSEMDVSVMPSICHESFSYTIREALAVGIPVIVSNTRAQSDAIVGSFNGLHFKRADPHDLKAKLELLVGERQMVRELSSNARKGNARSIGSQAREMEALYKKCVRAGESRRPVKLEQAFPAGRPLINLLSYVRSLEDAERRRLTEEKNRSLRLTEQLSNLSRELALRESTIQSLEAEKLEQTEQLNRADRELAERESAIRSMEDEKLRLTEQLSNVSRELALRESTIQSLEAEKAALAQDLSKAMHELSSLLRELGAIRESFGYHIMRSYAKRIDRLLPEGTRRGKFRKAVVATFRTIVHDGAGSFLRDVCKKMRKSSSG